MRNDFYKAGFVEELINTDLVTPTTKQVLFDRIDKPEVTEPRYFKKEHFETLKAVCARLIPQPTRQNIIDLPGLLDEQMILGEGNGWRYASMPGDDQAILLGLTGIDEAAVTEFSDFFFKLTTFQQDVVLVAVQRGDTKATVFKRFSSALFFEELLARLVELYYSHPFAKDEIGDTSFADNKGWQKTAYNEVEDYESSSLKHTYDR